MVALGLLPSTRAENVILFIGDGMGFGQVEAAHYFNGGNLSFEGFVRQAQVTTRSADNSVTDSAAAGTAIATAYKVNNGVISLALPGDGLELETLLEFYQKRGKRVGLITTTYLTHATPATFGAHTSSRNNTTEIGSDLLQQTRPNILFGGGGYGLDAAAAAAAGYLVTTDTSGFGVLDSASSHLAALFGTGYLPYEYDYLDATYQYPHLSDMVAKALSALGNAPNGFFLMVEGGMIDQACHANDLRRAIHETLELSRAVQVALSWAQTRPATTILVTADHETGGLSVTSDKGPGNYPEVRWSTTGHTAANVPVYAWGRNAEFAMGTLDNTDFFNWITAENLFSPVIARVAATVLDETSVRVNWLTDVASSSRVDYGLSAGSETFTANTADAVMAHSVLLSGLSPGKKYYYRVTSQDQSSATATSAEYTFIPVSLVDPGTLIAAGSVWKYHDTGANLGTTWSAPAYDDTSWQSGPAKLGYGDGNEATVLSYGPDPNNKWITCYFRHTFAVDHPAAFTDLRLSVLRDDGAVVYLNGIEVARYNLPSGTITSTTLASVASDFAWDAALSIANGLVAGANVLAVEVHQANPTSSDLCLDLALTATRLDYDAIPPVIGSVAISEITDRSAVITWTTDEPADSSVHYGVSEDFGSETGSPGLVTSHRVLLTALGANSIYRFAVRSADANGNVAFGEETSFTTSAGSAPIAPAGLTAVAQSSSTILLTWTDTSDNETGFEIYQVRDATIDALIGSTGPNASSVLITELQASTAYTFYVRAFNGAGSADSDVAVATTLPLPKIPAAPSELTAMPISDSEIELGWVDGAENEAGFRVERSFDGGTWQIIATLAPNATRMVDGGLTSGMVHYYRVSAFNDGGQSAPSPAAAAAPFIYSFATGETTVAGTMNGTYANTIESDAVYQQLTEALSGGKPNTRYNSLEHRWTFQVTPGSSVVFFIQAHRTASSDGDTFVVAYSTDNSTYQDMATVTATTASDVYQWFGLPATLQGTVYVRVRDTDRTVGKSGLDTLYVDRLLIRTDVTPLLTPPLAPVLTGATAGDQRVTLSWTASDGATSYEVWRNPANGSEPIVGGWMDTSYTDSDLVNGTAYEYRVAAVNAYGRSDFSNSLTATPQATTVVDPPTQLTANAAKRKISLSWIQSSTPGVTQNKIYRSSTGVSGSFVFLKTISAATSSSDTVPSGSTYHYVVTAVGSGGESGVSNVATATAK